MDTSRRAALKRLAWCVFFSASLASAQSCVPQGTSMTTLAKRVIDSVDKLQSADARSSAALIGQMKIDLEAIEKMTGCFEKKANEIHTQCLARSGEAFQMLAQAERDENQLAEILQTIQVDVTARSTEEALLKQRLGKLQEEVAANQNRIQSRRNDLAKYDWIKWVCYPCKALAEAITRDEGAIRNLQASIRDLEQEKQTLPSAGAIEKVRRSTELARNDLNANKLALKNAQDSINRDITAVKTTIVFLQETSLFWGKLGQLVTYGGTPELNAKARETRRWLDGPAPPASFDDRTATPATAMLGEELLRFASSTDDRGSRLMTADSSSCLISSAAEVARARNALTGVLPVSTVLTSRGKTGGTVELASIVLKNSQPENVQCDFRSPSSDIQHGLLYIKPNETLKLYALDEVKARVKGYGGSFQGLTISCFIDYKDPARSRTRIEALDGFVLYKPFNRFPGR